MEGCDCVPNAFIFLQELEQGAQAGGAEPGGVEEVEAPPEPTPVVEIVPAPAEEEEDQEAPDNPPTVILDVPPEGVPMAPVLLHRLVEATSNVVSSTRISGQQAPAPRQPSKVPVPAHVPRQSSWVRAQPPPHRPPTATPPASSGGGSGVQKVVYTGPYINWNPSQAQLQECIQLLRGEGYFGMEAYISCLPLSDSRRAGNHKWLCKWEGCGRVMTSQGEIRAHALTHLDLRSAPTCSCSKNTFSNAKTLGHHLRKFHNISLDALRDKINPQPILESVTRPHKQ